MWAFLFFTTVVWADEKPSWFAADYKSNQEWGFYCQGDGKNETEALQSARAQCSSKMCLLFGVEVDYQVTSQEDLKNASVTATTIERCPAVRVVGRVEKKKTVECADTACSAFVYQLYPKTEYDKEFQRLNQPKISQVIEKTIIVREGSQTFADPKPCLASLEKYSKIRGERPEQSKLRIESLEAAVEKCRGLDYRDVNLASKMNGFLIIAGQARDISTTLRLNQLLTVSSTPEEKTKAYLDFEKSLLSSDKKVPALKIFLEKNYDALFGNRGPIEDYVAELASCKAHGQMLRVWPADFTSSLTPCRQRADSTEKVCYSMDVTMARAKYLGCICNLGAKSIAQECTRTLFGYLNEVCPSQINDECMKSFAKYVAETMKIKIK